MALGTPTESSLPPRVAALVVLLAISVFINYVDRGNLSIAAPMLNDVGGRDPRSAQLPKCEVPS